MLGPAFFLSVVTNSNPPASSISSHYLPGMCQRFCPNLPPHFKRLRRVIETFSTRFYFKKNNKLNIILIYYTLRNFIYFRKIVLSYFEFTDNIFSIVKKYLFTGGFKNGQKVHHRITLQFALCNDACIHSIC